MFLVGKLVFWLRTLRECDSMNETWFPNLGESCVCRAFCFCRESVPPSNASNFYTTSPSLCDNFVRDVEECSRVPQYQENTILGRVHAAIWMANSAIDRLIFSESPMSSQQTGDDLLRQGHFPEASLHYIQALHDAHHPTPSEEPESESGSPPPPDSDLITSLEEKLAQCDRFTACQDPSFVNVVQVAWGRQSEDQLLGRWEPSEFLLNQFPPGKYTEGSELYEIQIVQRRKALEEARENCRKKFRLPRLVQPLQGDGVITGACGHKASGVVTATGQLLMWGYNGAGLLGQGDRTDRKSPERVTQFFKSSPLAKEKLHQVFTSTSFDEPRLSQDQEEETEEVTYNLTTPTETSSSSSKGHGFAPVRQAETRSRLPPKREVVYSFEYDRLLPAVRIVQVTVSYEHSLALASDGRVFSCGRNTHGQLGNGDVDSVVNPFFVMVRKTCLPSSCDILTRVDGRFVI